MDIVEHPCQVTALHHIGKYGGLGGGIFSATDCIMSPLHLIIYMDAIIIRVMRQRYKSVMGRYDRNFLSPLVLEHILLKAAYLDNTSTHVKRVLTTNAIPNRSLYLIYFYLPLSPHILGKMNNANVNESSGFVNLKAGKNYILTISPAPRPPTRTTGTQTELCG